MDLSPYEAKWFTDERPPQVGECVVCIEADDELAPGGRYVITRVWSGGKKVLVRPDVEGSREINASWFAYRFRRA